MKTLRRNKNSRPWPMLAWIAIATLVAACASLPPPKPVGDLKNLSGKWEGYGGSTRLGSGPIQLSIKEDGSVDGFLPQVGPGGTAFTATLRPNGDKLSYESNASTGTVTLHEGDGRRVLRGETSRKDGTDTGWFEVSPVK